MPFSFLHPLLFAIGAACVSIPIIIHLLKRRRRVVSWGAMRFLEEAYRKRRRIITLEQLVLLSLRCLLVLFIALGVGSIVLGRGAGTRQARTLVLVLDDSISSARTVGDSTVLELSKESAIAELDTLDPVMGDRVALISASSPARPIVLPASDDLGAVRTLIEQAESTDAAFDLGGVLGHVARVDDGADREGGRQLMIASDARSFEHAVSGMRDEPVRQAFDSVLLPSPEPTPALNVGIRSAKPTRTLLVRDGLSMPESIQIELVRSGEVGSENSTQIRVIDTRGQTRGTGVITWRTGERSRTVGIAIRTDGLQADAASSALLRVQLSEDVNPRDNGAYVPLPIRNALRVSIVDRPRDAAIGGGGAIPPARWLRAALAPRGDMGVQITSVDASQAAARLVQGVDVVFVLSPAELNDAAWDRVERLRDQGVMVVVAPDTQSESLAWIERVRGMEPGAFGQVVDARAHEPALNLDPRIESASLLVGIGSEFEQLISGVSVFRSLDLGSGGQPIASMSDGSLLGVQVRGREGEGMLVVLSVAFDLGWSNLPARPLFVAMVQELVRQGVGLSELYQAVIAGDPLPRPSWVESVRVVELQADESATDPALGLNASAGVLALRDAQGLTRAAQVVWADAEGAVADAVEEAQVAEQIERFVEAPELRWIGAQDTSESRSVMDEVFEGERNRLALWALWWALACGVLEFLLARLFTQRLLASERAMGAEGRGVRA
ncbi:MAG: BatA and WFA domain-containing protein [Phycisphaerales bacterium]|nr:BatA and WFA domain-containing protein [Phycisphaerales bacterium]